LRTSSHYVANPLNSNTFTITINSKAKIVGFIFSTKSFMVLVLSRGAI